jgi:hypothetical protein
MAFGRSADVALPLGPKPFLDGVSAAVGGKLDRKLGALGVIMLGLIAINVLTPSDSFWAAWPLLAFAVIAGLSWARTARLDRGIATLAVLSLGIIGINILSGIGDFWAKWPLLGFAVAAGVRWFMRRGASGDAVR